MGRGLSAFLIVVACTGGASAQVDARSEKIDGLLRIVGAQAGIVLYCGKFYTVDQTVSDALSRTVRKTLDKALGRKQAQAAIDLEGARVSSEIERVGVEEWCADQREILNADGTRIFRD
ncbi:hypothetical protein [Methylobacterium sp. A54F]